MRICQQWFTLLVLPHRRHLNQQRIGNLSIRTLPPIILKIVRSRSVKGLRAEGSTPLNCSRSAPIKTDISKLYSSKPHICATARATSEDNAPPVVVWFKAALTCIMP